MPIGFMGQMPSGQVVSLSDDQKSLIHYLAGLMRSSTDVANSFHVSLELKLSFKRSAATPGTVAVTVSSDADAVKVTLSEEDVRQRYPWDYADLTGHLKSRYSDFKENSKYHQHRKNLALEKGLAMMRYLDPGNPRSSKKEFYSPNIVRRFDELYTVRTK